MPSASDWELINGLRKTLPNAVITTVKYEPLIGIATIIDPAGQLTTFEYEDLNRLKLIKDNAGNKKESYDYRFKN
jgi:YD repeat-containing protein